MAILIDPELYKTSKASEFLKAFCIPQKTLIFWVLR